MHKYLYAHGNPIGNVDPSGQVTLGSLGTSIATAAKTFGVVSSIGTAALSVGSAGVYKFYFNASPIKGGIVGAQLGLALATSYTLGGGGPKGFQQVSETIQAGFFSGLNKLIGQAIRHTVEGSAWEPHEIVQDFYEGFAAGAVSRTFGDFLELRTGIDDPKTEALASLAFTIGTEYVHRNPDFYYGEITFVEATRGVAYNTIPAWLQSTAIDKVLAAEGVAQPLRGLVKTALGTSYFVGLEAINKIFSFK